MKKVLNLIFFSLLFSFSLMAQTKVAFLGALSDSKDTSTIELTEDLYFSKASLIPNITVADFRTKSFKNADLSSYSNFNFVFYPEIQESGAGWKCIFHGINVKTKEEVTSQKEYDSYYKILMDAKNELDSFFATLSLSQSGNRSENFENRNSTSISTLSLENISGTWKGENYIDKIVILRGGRGFVIFNNGASMNISIEIEKNTCIATQTSSANASFFPEISREKAMKMAPTAEPIVWKLKYIGKDSMQGTKRTLQESNEIAVLADIPVTWTKIQ